MGRKGQSKYPEEDILENAKKYSSRGEWQLKDNGYYTASTKYGKMFHDKACEHMISKVIFSIPQMMCRKILEQILDAECVYNDQETIKPKELDIYFPQWKMAFEYNGIKWHKMDDVIIRDKIKNDVCVDMGIRLFTIKQKSKVVGNYEKDIKIQIRNILPQINNITNKNITNEDIDRIDCVSVYNDIINLNYKNLGNIEEKINSCKTLAEFNKKFRNESIYLKKSNNSHLVERLRTKPLKVTNEEIISAAKQYNSISDFKKHNNNMYDLCKKRKLLDIATPHMHRKKVIRPTLSNEELINACKKHTNLTTFTKDHYWLYQRCKDNGIFEEATKHMSRTRNKYYNYSDDFILNKISKYIGDNDVRHKDHSLYSEIVTRNLQDKVTYRKVITSKDKIKQCFLESEKYDNIFDFKNDINLYHQCKKYKIVEKIIKNFDMDQYYFNEAMKFNTLEEFTSSDLYRQISSIKGLTKKIKRTKGWCCNLASYVDHTKEYPEVIELLKSGMCEKHISDKTKVSYTKVNYIHKKMNNFILPVSPL
jgi:hypothetical protein